MSHLSDLSPEQLKCRKNARKHLFRLHRANTRSTSATCAAGSHPHRSPPAMGVYNKIEAFA